MEARKTQHVKHMTGVCTHMARGRGALQAKRKAVHILPSSPQSWGRVLRRGDCPVADVSILLNLGEENVPGEGRNSERENSFKSAVGQCGTSKTS